MNRAGKHLLEAITFTSFCVSLLSGCVTVKDEIFLRNVEVGGPVNQLPMHITDAEMKSTTFTVSPFVSVSPQRSMTTSLERQYSGTIPDTLADFRRTGLQWGVPSVRFGLDLDYAVSGTVALMGGISTSVGKERQFLAGYGGVGLFSADTGVGLRLNVGVQYTDMSYTGATVLVRTTTPFGGSPTQDTAYFLDRGKESHLNLFADLTLNTSNRGWPVNYFIQFGVNPQTITRFTPSQSVAQFPFGTQIVSDQRSESSVLWISAVPGIYFSIGPSRRVVLGVRLLKDVLSETASPDILVIPMMQLDWRL